MKLGLRRALLGWAAGMVLFTPQAFANDPYPSKPIKLVLAFGPGTGTDILGRLLAQKLTEELGQSVYVENRPGAGGVIGTAAVAKSPADGYTLTLGTNATLITSPILVGNAPYQADRDFTPIGTVARTPLVLMTANLPTAPQTVAELVARAKSGAASFSSAGVGTIGHLTSEVVVRKLGLTVSHVPYKGSGQALTDLARGELLFGIDTPAAGLPLVQGGRLRALAVTGDARLAALPQTPTLAESGVPDVRLTVWWGLLAPAGTPSPIVDRLASALSNVVASPDMQRRAQEMALEPLSYSKDQFAGFIREELPFWQKFLKAAGIKLE
jgi:tripartite-type tricarboxylate transporter receptor subunit TctC